jgi:hypothetical protein
MTTFKETARIPIDEQDLIRITFTPFSLHAKRHAMIRINDNYLKLKASYLFPDIAKRVAAHQQRQPDQAVIRAGHRRCDPRPAHGLYLRLSQGC